MLVGRVMCKLFAGHFESDCTGPGLPASFGRHRSPVKCSAASDEFDCSTYLVLRHTIGIGIRRLS